MKDFSVKLTGFKTMKQALEFLSWYEGGGEQQFYDHLEMVGKSAADGCNVDMHHKGNTGKYYDVNENEVSAKIK